MSARSGVGGRLGVSLEGLETLPPASQLLLVELITSRRHSGHRLLRDRKLDS